MALSVLLTHVVQSVVFGKKLAGGDRALPFMGMKGSTEGERRACVAAVKAVRAVL